LESDASQSVDQYEIDFLGVITLKKCILFSRVSQVPKLNICRGKLVFCRLVCLNIRDEIQLDVTKDRVMRQCFFCHCI